MTVVNALPVEAVLETQAECSDADRARAALSEALIAARAPARGGASLRGARPTSPTTSPGAAHWTVTMSVAPALSGAAARSGRSKSVEAVIVDDAGTIVAQRTLTDRSARTCMPLARAVGAWASLVLDAELVRAKDDDGSVPTPPSSSSPAPGSSSAPPAGSRPAGSGSTRSAAIAVMSTSAERDTASSSDERDSSHVAPRAFEVGSTVYIRNGMTATGAVAGVSPFLAVEVAEAWVFRPALMLGRSTESASATSQVGARADVCRRIPGNYIERRGIEADLCGGFEGSVVTIQSGPHNPGDSRGRVGLGPSAALRGELAGGVALELRGLVGANLAQAALRGQAEIPLVFAAAELGFSVRLR